MRTTTRLLAVLLGYAVPSSALADIIHVPADYPTIQAAIDAATDGDEIIVAPGTYFENLNFLGKAITLCSAKGADVTVIDGSRPVDLEHGSVVTFESGEGSASILEGMTIMNGTGTHAELDWATAYFGGGVYCVGSSPTIRNCVIRDNEVLQISNSSGGGVFLYDNASPTLVACVLSYNSAVSLGGGLYADLGSSADLTDCILAENSAQSGAGAYFYGVFGGAEPSNVRRCSFVENHASIAGGAIRATHGAVVRIQDCFFVGNSSEQFSSALSVSSLASVDITNSVISDSLAASGATIEVFMSGELVLSNTTIARNTSSGDVGAVYCVGGGSNTLISNCILWDNESTVWPEISVGLHGIVAVGHSTIKGGQDAVDAEGTLLWGVGNIDLDPEFVDAPGADYHLLPGSPCIDAADSSAVPPDIETDLDGDPRFVDDLDTEDTGAGSCPFVEMGAFEYQEGIAGCCRPDFNGDGIVGPFDLASLLGAWGPCPGCPQDFNGDGVVGPIDLATLLGAWGPCP